MNPNQDNQDPLNNIDLGSSISQSNNASVNTDVNSNDDPLSSIDLSPKAQNKPIASQPNQLATGAPVRTPIGTDKADLQKYSDMPLSEVAQSAATHLLPSAGAALSGIGHAIVNPTETLSAFKQLGQGAYSKVQGALGETQDPTQKAETEKLLNALGSHYSETYGTKGGFKKALALDPASVGMDLSVPLSMGASAGANAAGVTGRVASLAGKLGTVLDPIQASLAVAKGIGKGVGAVTRAGQGLTTGVSPGLLKVATAAGSTADPELRSAFLTHLSGDGDLTDIATNAQRGFAEIKAQKSAEYMASKEGIIANQNPLNYNKVDQAIQDAREKTQFAGVQTAFKPANDALNDAQLLIDGYKKAPLQAQTIEGFDNLKQAIWDLKTQNPNPSAQTALQGVYNSVKNTIVERDPAYAKLMQTYSDGLNNTNDILKTLGLGNKTAASAAVAKMLKATKTGGGQTLLDQLSMTQSGRTLPYMLAGQALSPWGPGGTRSLLDLGLMYGAAAIHPGLAGGIAASSPRVMGNLNYAIGKGQQIAAPFVSKPVTYGASQLGEALPSGRQQAPQQPLVTPKTHADFINQNMAHARQVAAETGLDPNVVLAQSALESGWGQHAPGNNMFGIKGGNNNLSTSEYQNGQLIPTKSNFRSYYSPGESFQDYSKFIRENPRYSNVLKATSPNQQISEMGKSGYATDPNYEQKLRNILQEIQYASNQNAATGGSIIARASGGRVGKNHGHLVNRLMKLADKAKKSANSVTEPLLNVADEHIVKALHIANRAI